MTRLIVVHYHWRVGGVRRVVEVGVPALVSSASMGIGEVVFVAGEAAESAWERQMRAQLENLAPVSFVVEPAFGYVAEWGGSIESLRHGVREAAARVLAGPAEETLVLLENPAVGRNLLVARALADACRAAGAWLFCHHHDYFFDGRWERWPEIEACGFRTASDAMAAAFPLGAPVWHFAISDPKPRLLEPGAGSVGCRTSLWKSGSDRGRRTGNGLAARARAERRADLAVSVPAASAEEYHRGGTPRETRRPARHRRDDWRTELAERATLCHHARAGGCRGWLAASSRHSRRRRRDLAGRGRSHAREREYRHDLVVRGMRTAGCRSAIPAPPGGSPWRGTGFATASWRGGLFGALDRQGSP